MELDLLVAAPESAPTASRHSMLVERLLDHVQALDHASLQPFIDEVRRTLVPLEELSRADPDTQRRTEWLLALARLERAMLRLLDALDADQNRSLAPNHVRLR